LRGLKEYLRKALILGAVSRDRYRGEELRGIKKGKPEWGGQGRGRRTRDGLS